MHAIDGINEHIGFHHDYYSNYYDFKNLVVLMRNIFYKKLDSMEYEDVNNTSTNSLINLGLNDIEYHDLMKYFQNNESELKLKLNKTQEELNSLKIELNEKKKENNELIEKIKNLEISYSNLNNEYDQLSKSCDVSI